MRSKLLLLLSSLFAVTVPPLTAVDPGLRRVYMVNKDSQTVSVLSY